MPRPLAADHGTAIQSNGAEAAASDSSSTQMGLFEYMLDRPEFDAYRESTIAYYKPQDVVEQFSVDRIIQCKWSLKRISRWETAFLDHAIDKAIEDSAEEEPDEDAIIASVMANLCSKDGHPKIFRSYRRHLQRSLKIAQDTFALMRSQS